MMNTVFLTGLAAGITLTYFSKPTFRAIRRGVRRAKARLFRKAYAKEAAIRAKNRALIMAELEKPVYEK